MCTNPVFTELMNNWQWIQELSCSQWFYKSEVAKEVSEAEANKSSGVDLVYWSSSALTGSLASPFSPLAGGGGWSMGKGDVLYGDRNNLMCECVCRGILAAWRPNVSLWQFNWKTSERISGNRFHLCQWRCGNSIEKPQNTSLALTSTSASDTMATKWYWQGYG